jgi:hypothetical protein
LQFSESVKRLDQDDGGRLLLLLLLLPSQQEAVFTLE